MGSKINREKWLENAVEFLNDYMELKDYTPVPVLVSCGWPLKGGTRERGRVIGQCFNKVTSENGIAQIFISPSISDSVQVLGTLLHEMIHAVVGTQAGHKGPFVEAARKLGLTGKATATEAGPELVEMFKVYIQHAGAYPHAALRLINATGKRPGSRLRLYQCECDKPVKVRVASNDFQAICSICNTPFRMPDTEEGEGENDE
jgi:hypothetical protein